MFKDILLMILIVGIAILIFSAIDKNTPEEPIISDQIPEQTVPKGIELCFYKETPTVNGEYFDTAWLRIDLQGPKVTGEFINLPVQTDSNFGKFEGTVGPVVPEMMARIADVLWDSESEGMKTKRELRIIFGEGTARVGFGDLQDRGDGVYVYTDKENIETWQELTDVDCADLDDREIVAKYIRENIVSLVPEEPVLGGTFYALGIRLDPRTKTGTMEYEDGHIAGSASFSYTREGNNVSITNVQKVN